MPQFDQIPRSNLIESLSAHPNGAITVRMPPFARDLANEIDSSIESSVSKCAVPKVLRFLLISSLASADEAIDDDEFILITRLEAQAQAKPQTKAALPRPMLKRFRIEDNDNDNERETDGDEISKIGNNDDYILSEEPEEVSKSSLERVIRSRETRKKPRKNLPYY